MAQLLLRGVALGEVKGVLFDKDGTLSLSEPQLITLAEARVFLCLQRVEAELRPELQQLLWRAYGLRPASSEQGRSAICPAGITAVASRDHNLIATATALVQVGLGWPEALSLSEAVFAAADQLDARRAMARQSNPAMARPVTPAEARPLTDLVARPFSDAGASASGAAAGRSTVPGAARSFSAGVPRPDPGKPECGDNVALAGLTAAARAELRGAEAAASSPNVDAGGHEPDQAGADNPAGTRGDSARCGQAPNPSQPELAIHLDSAGRPTGGTSRTTEGLRDWLEQLRAASVACAVISNDDVAGIEHFLASHGLEPYFQAIWSAEHRPRKPDPAAVHGLCAQLGLSAADCALIGDANSDLRMAVAAGIPHQLALGYTAAWSTPPPLAAPHPLVHHWRELSLA